MVKVLFALAILGGLGWAAYQELDLGEADAPVAPSVGYPHVEPDGVGGVGEGTGGLLGP